MAVEAPEAFEIAELAGKPFGTGLVCRLGGATPVCDIENDKRED